MQNAFVVTGVMTDGQTVALDECLPLANTKVRVVLEPLEASAARTYAEVMATIRQRQQLRGYRPPTREGVDSDIQAERDSWPE